MASKNCDDFSPPLSPSTSKRNSGNQVQLQIPLQRLPEAPPPLERLHPSTQSLSSASCPPALTQTRDVVKMFTMLSLYTAYGKQGIIFFDHEQFYGWQDHDILKAIKNIEEQWIATPTNLKIVKDMACKVHSQQGDEAREAFCGVLGDKLFNRNPEKGQCIDWTAVAMGISITAYLIEILAVRNPVDTKIHEFIDWCYLYYRSMGIDRWIVDHGGWAQFALEFGTQSAETKC